MLVFKPEETSLADTEFAIPKPTNEPVLNYLSDSREREDIKLKIREMKSSMIDIPLIIGGREVRTEHTAKSVMPHLREHVLAEYHVAGEEETIAAIDASLEARAKWSTLPWHHRAAIFLKAADLLAGPWRSTVNAATMLNLSKNLFQAEIDAANELVDFLRFNVYYMQQIYQMQTDSAAGEWNRIEYRPLEGFVFAVTPFNFASIMGNLPSAPAMMGNVVVWKPASSAVYAAYHIMQVFQEAGVPPGVINFIPGPGAKVGAVALKHPALAGVHFTGSTDTFTSIWKTVGSNIDNYRSFPRLVGETGGKDFIFAHNSAQIDELVTALIRGSFEYQGQKCSACSRAYIPLSIWPAVKDRLLFELQRVKIGDPEDFSALVNAVIDRPAFEKIVSYVEEARRNPDAEIVAGGGYDASRGYFIQPTVIRVTDPLAKTMKEEIFGPVLSIYVYADDEYESTLKTCDATSPYALTGSIFARNRQAIAKATECLVNAAGNFYINDKPTGAVVSRQPFGGARKSGTNDKAGSSLNLLRWVSPRVIKENFVPSRRVSYPYMETD
jgi:1-pyrroline-5-carboxylate dehydrogenase